ncbi:RHS repeat-associated core domain-containing protein [Pseudoxanthomonas mexicana]|jgi:hypothetical protein|uniref:RHS repeat-associated core domain-containing protein n=1 Tax=Pseudoxanthomonas mexicana TaxID=128785 RepID=UPI0028AD650A|nr:RHS repeat-associated core domain-containing protein [Pseudoxanthomonas mexicana]
MRKVIPWTLLISLSMLATDASARFVSTDPVQAQSNTGANFNRYHYANNNPYKFTDPDGRDCVSTDGQTTCSTANYVVTFPAQKGFQDFTTKSPNYHAYSVPANTPGKTLEQNQHFVKNNPTPGFSSPATPQGTFNDATPVIGGISPVAISPVMSFSLTNQLNGQPVVVNVTLPGHPLESGIVVRQPTVDANGNSTIQNWGEGTSSLQAPGAWTAKPINSVWTEQKLGTPNPTGCASGRDSVCNK